MPNTVDIFSQVPELRQHTQAFNAVRTGNIAFLTKLCEEKFDFNDPRDTNDFSLLMVAATQGKYDIVNLLLKHGAHVNMNTNMSASPSEQTALLQAMFSGNLDCIKLLLEHKADVNQSNQNGTLPLDIAITQKNTESMHLLLQYNADCNKASKTGMTPLMWAVKPDNELIILDLLKHGADTTLKNRWGETAFDRALEKNLFQSATLLKSSDFFDKFAQEYFLTTALYETSKSLYRNNTNLNDDAEIVILLKRIANQKEGLKEPLHDGLLDRFPRKSIFIRLRATFYDLIMECMLDKKAIGAHNILEELSTNITAWLEQGSISERQAQVCREFFTLENMQEITHSSQETVENAA